MDTTPTEVLKDLPLDQVDESPSNPRKRFDPQQLAELAADLRANGQLQPVRVRPQGERWELVIGARRLRALRLAGLPTVQAIVREYSDREVLEAQISENGQRDNVHPLEEADALHQLHDQHGVPVEEIAARLGTGTAFVRRRLQLARLPAEGREALFGGKLSVCVAELVGRLPPAHQPGALAEILKPRPSWENSEGLWTVRAAGQWIRQRFHLRLEHAAFDANDAALVPEAGACAACPKNTATQRDLFGDLGQSEECLDSACFARKIEAAWVLKTAEAREAGKRVLSVDESARALSYGQPQKGYVSLADKAREVGDGRKTWAQVLKKHLPPTVVVRGNVGAAVELVTAADLKAAKKACGIEAPKKDTGKSNGKSPHPVYGSADWKARQAHEEKVDEELLQAMSRAAQAHRVDADDRAWWQALAKTIAGLLHEGSLQVAKLRKLDRPRLGQANPLFEEIEVLSPSGCRALIVELLVGELEESAQAFETIEPLAKVYGVSLAEIEKKVTDEEAPAKGKTPAKSAVTKAGKAAAPTKPKPAKAKPARAPGGP